MADRGRDDRGRPPRRQPPTIDLSWQFEVDTDGTWIATLRAFLGGHWDGGIPTQVQFFVHGLKQGEPALVVGRFANKPVSGFIPGEKVLIEVVVGGMGAGKMMDVPKVPERVLRLAVTEPRVNPAGTAFAATLIATFGDGWATGNVLPEVEFRRDGRKVGSARPDKSRQAKLTLYDFCPGKYLVEVMAEESRAFQSLTIADLPKPKLPEERELELVERRTTLARARQTLAEVSTPKPPTDLKVYAHPHDPAEQYFITIELFGEDRLPVKGWPIEIKDWSHPDPEQRRRIVRSELDGAYRWEVEAQGHREIFVSVVGTELDYTLKLPGPTPKRLLPPPSLPEWSADDLNGSWWDRFMRGWKKGSEVMRERSAKQ